MAEMFANLIIRPPRVSYQIEELGPDRFMIGEKIVIRKDFTLVNRSKLKIECSHYKPVASDGSNRVVGKLPCVIYLHGNSGSRLDADDLIDCAIPLGWSVLSLDFTGCGLSEGEYVTLGEREALDLRAVLEHLKTDPDISSIGIVGRSMGAATAVLVAADHEYAPLISGMVLDSCYTSLQQVVNELGLKYVGKIPLIPFESMVDSAIWLLREAVLVKSGVDLAAIDVLASAQRCTTPALFGHAEGDELVYPSHSREMHAHYGGRKDMMLFKGDHNSMRPEEFQRRSLEFLGHCFALREEEETRKRYRELQAQRVMLFGLRSSPQEDEISMSHSCIDHEKGLKDQWNYMRQATIFFFFFMACFVLKLITDTTSLMLF